MSAPCLLSTHLHIGLHSAAASFSRNKQAKENTPDETQERVLSDTQASKQGQKLSFLFN